MISIVLHYVVDLKALVFVVVSFACPSVSSFLLERLVNFEDVVAKQVLSLEEHATLLTVEGAPVLSDTMNLQAPEPDEAGQEAQVIFRNQ